MIQINAGRARFLYCGIWSDTTAYNFYDWVFFNGSSYLCINTEGAPAGTELTDEVYWAPMAQKGDTPTTAEIQTIINSMNIDAKTLNGQAPDYYRCANGCSWTCSSGSTGGCLNGCTGGCLNACTGGCSSCTGTCSGSCTNTCTGGCTGCTGTCSGSCTGCTGTCTGSCSDTCTGGCIGCTATCKSGCVVSCTGDCGGTCGKTSSRG